MNRAKVSIVTAAYNSENFILKAYESIRLQSYSEWEWLVTDDCSTDSTFEILSSVANEDSRVKLFRTDRNSGAAAGRNISIGNATGKYIAFIDSDDVWEHSKLEKQLFSMEDGGHVFTFTAYGLIDESGRKLGKVIDAFRKEPVGYEDMLRKKATIGCSTVMLDREAYDDLAMPSIRTGQDYALWLRLLRNGVTAMPINETLSHYRIRPNSISRNKLKKAARQWQIYRELECLGLLVSLECFALYAWRAITR